MLRCWDRHLDETLKCPGRTCTAAKCTILWWWCTSFLCLLFLGVRQSRVATVTYAASHRRWLWYSFQVLIVVCAHAVIGGVLGFVIGSCRGGTGSPGNEEKLVTKHFMYMSLDKYIFYLVCVTRVPCAELLHEIRDSTLLGGLSFRVRL